MCAVSLAPAMAAVAVSQTGLQFYQANETARSAKKVADRNSQNATRSAILSYTAIAQKTAAEAARAAQSIAKVRRDSEVTQGAAKAAAASGGVTGVSVQEMLDDFQRQEGMFVDATLLNEEYARMNAELEKKNTALGLEGRQLASIPAPPPDPFAFAIEAGIGGYSAYQQGELISSKTKG